MNCVLLLVTHIFIILNFTGNMSFKPTFVIYDYGSMNMVSAFKNYEESSCINIKYMLLIIYNSLMKNFNHICIVMRIYKLNCNRIRSQQTLLSQHKQEK